MSPYTSRQSTGKMTNRPHFTHIQRLLGFSLCGDPSDTSPISPSLQLTLPLPYRAVIGDNFWRVAELRTILTTPTPPYHSPRNFYKLIPLPVFFCNFFCNFSGNSLRPPIFFVTPMRSSGSRMDWKIYFCKFYEILFLARIFFFVLQKFWC